MGRSALKKCNKCGESKSLDNYYKHSKYKNCLRGDCKKCHSRRGREDYIRNKDKYDTRLWSEHLKRNYGISIEDYIGLHDAQKGKCKICNEQETRFNNKSKKTQKLSVDHCHRSGRIRGLLCTRCNTTLGKVNEDTALLQDMINYLEEA